MTIREMPTRTMRRERDTMGELDVPADAYYGAQTRRAELNFPISDLRFPRRFIEALGLIKRPRPRSIWSLGCWTASAADAIVAAAREVAEGVLDDQFPLDIFQTGRAPRPT